MSINKLGEILGIPVYQDANMEDDKYLVIYKSKMDVGPGIVYVPIENLSKGEGAIFDQEEIDRILKMKKNRSFSDIKAFICKSLNKATIQKISNSIEKI